MARDDGRLKSIVKLAAFASWFAASQKTILVGAYLLTLQIEADFRRDWINRYYGAELSDAAGGPMRVVAKREWPEPVQ